MTSEAFCQLIDQVPRGWANAIAHPAPPRPAPGSFAEFASAVAFGGLWTREVLSVRERRLVMLAALATQGCWGGVETHVASALALGDLTHEDVEELAVTLSVYAGIAVGVAVDARNRKPADGV